MSIWFERPDVADMNRMVSSKTLNGLIGIEITEVGDDYIKGTMPADERTFQAYGVVHGGANVVLAETLGSLAGCFTVDQSKFQAYGQEVSANHIRSVSSGLVTGIAKAVHLGKRSQIWEIRLENDDGKLTCISRLTLAVVPVRQ